MSGCKWYGSAPFKCYSRKSFRETGCPSGTYWIKDDSYGETRKSNGALVKGNYCWFGRVKKYCCNNSKLISLYKISLLPGINFKGLLKLSSLIIYVLSDWDLTNESIPIRKGHNVLKDNLINSAIGNSYYKWKVLWKPKKYKTIYKIPNNHFNCIVTCCRLLYLTCLVYLTSNKLSFIVVFFEFYSISKYDFDHYRYDQKCYHNESKLKTLRKNWL